LAARLVDWAGHRHTIAGTFSNLATANHEVKQMSLELLTRDTQVSGTVISIQPPLPPKSPKSPIQTKIIIRPERPMAIVFTITEKLQGGYTASAIGEAIATEGKDIEDLYANIRSSTIAYFEADQVPTQARLYFLREEVLYIFPDRANPANN
jgi:hypothetical protein